MKNLTRYKSQFPLEVRRGELKISHWQLLHCEAISFGENGNWQPLSNVLATLWHAARVCLSPLANMRFPLARLKGDVFLGGGGGQRDLDFPVVIVSRLSDRFKVCLFCSCCLFLSSDCV